MSISDSLASVTVLRPDAIRRLMSDYKELIRNPIMFANAMPIDDADLKVWKCVVMGVDGAYNKVSVFFTLEFPADYPNSAPHAYFNSPIQYNNGAQIKDNKGRTVVCLDLFGNFGKVHTEWGSSASGWSPAYSVSTILIQMQATFMDPDYFDHKEKAVSLVRDYKVPEYLKMPIPTRQTNSASSFESDVATNGLAHLNLNMINCYVNNDTTIKTNGEIFGFGVEILPNKKLSSPCEYLSEKAFLSGTRKSTTNQSFQAFLPLFISPDHWSHAQKKFIKSVEEICNLKGPQANSIPIEEKIFSVFSSLMNSSVVQVMNAKENKTANDKFIDGYFAFYRLLVELVNLYPKLQANANNKIEAFMKQINGRSKDAVPDLGEWLILLLISSPKYNWSDFADVFIEECDARNVFWYVKGNYNNPAKYPELGNPTVRINRTSKVFDATSISRHLVCFQIKFIQDAKMLNILELDQNYGQVPNQIKQSLKDIYKTIISISNWNDYFKWCGVKNVSDEIRCDQLINALRLSNQKGYTRK